MRVLQLNVWTGRMKGVLADFFAKNQFDIVCLQEAVWSNQDEALRNFCVTVDQIKELSGMAYEMRSSNWGMGFLSTGKLEQGNVILSREKIVSTKEAGVHGSYSLAERAQDFTEHFYTVQVAKLANGLNIVNHHGYWLPSPVGDETTVEAMRKVAKVVRDLQGPVVMCGDLNIIHASPAMRELDFLRDLTDEYGIDNTLSGLKFNGKVACDHILVNDAVQVRNFEVLDTLVSDHKGLIAEVET